MSNIIALPIVLPSLMAAVMVLAMRHDLVLQRIFGIASVSVVLAVAIYILTRAANGEVMVYELGAWPAPFGIVLAHNGNLTNATALQAELFSTDHRHTNTESDSEVLLNVLAHELERVSRGLTLTPAEVFAACTGACAVRTR